jgi:serine/threonine-protein kinase
VAVEPKADARIGSVLQGRYRVLASVSGGAMGEVYRGEHVQLKRAVAIKFLRSAFGHSPEFAKRFEREALMMSRLDHPHVIGVIDYGVADDPFIVMDFVTGRPLDDVLDGGPMQPARATAIARQVLAGLSHAHENGIIHRDIKPANVMLTNPTGTGDHVRILDFGLAKLEDVDQTMSGRVVGTPSYLAPEQAGGGRIDGRADIYSTGVLLFELLTGEKPFFHTDVWQLLRMHAEQPPPALREQNPKQQYSPALEEVVARALRKSPTERFPSPGAFSDALADTPEGGGVARAPDLGHAATEFALQTAPPGPRRSRRWILAVGLAAAAGVTWFAWPRVSDEVKRGASKALGALDRSRPDSDASAPTARTVADAKKRAASGDREGAIQALHEIRRRDPDNAESLFVLGTLYYEKGWVSEAPRFRACARRRKASP